jgi:hypothetical protein
MPVKDYANSPGKAHLPAHSNPARIDATRAAPALHQTDACCFNNRVSRRSEEHAVAPVGATVSEGILRVSSDGQRIML